MQRFVDDVSSGITRDDYDRAKTQSPSALTCSCGEEIADADVLLEKIATSTTWGAAATVLGGMLGGPAGAGVGLLVGICLSWDDLLPETVAEWTDLEYENGELSCPNCEKTYSAISEEEIVTPKQIRKILTE